MLNHRSDPGGECFPQLLSARRQLLDDRVGAGLGNGKSTQEGGEDTRRFDEHSDRFERLKVEEVDVVNGGGGGEDVDGTGVLPVLVASSAILGEAGEYRVCILTGWSDHKITVLDV